jgi:hypothetical protein
LDQAADAAPEKPTKRRRRQSPADLDQAADVAPTESAQKKVCVEPEISLDSTAFERAVQTAVVQLAKDDPSLDNVRFADLMALAARMLDCTVRQLSPFRDQVKQIAETEIRRKVSSCAGPAIFQRVAEVPWQSLAASMQRCIEQICRAVDQGHLTEAFVPRYMQLMSASDAADHIPLVPELGPLSHGALVALCGVLKVPPPAFLSKAEMENARERLSQLKGAKQWELTTCLCAMAAADMEWMSQQSVLGAGSVVLHGSSVRLPKVILRPRVSHDFMPGTKALVRELCYITMDGCFLKAAAISATIAKASWPLSSVPVKFAWQGPENPFYLGFKDMKLHAERYGMEVGNLTYDKLQPLFMAAAVLEYRRQFKDSVDTAWQAGQHAAETGPPEQQPAAQLSGGELAADNGPSEQQPATDAPLSGELAADNGPSEEQPATGALLSGEEPAAANGPSKEQPATGALLSGEELTVAEGRLQLKPV